MHITYMEHKRTEKVVPVASMRTLDYYGVQFFAYIDTVWRWRDAEEFGGPAVKDENIEN